MFGIDHDTAERLGDMAAELDLGAEWIKENRLSVDELAAALVRKQEEASDPDEPPPDWMLERRTGEADG